MFEKQIDKGVQWLDSHDKYWFNKINLDTLCMFTNDHCILSQWLRGNPIKGEFSSFDWNVEHGFSIEEFKDDDCKIEWIILKNEWVDRIKAKRRETKKELAEFQL